jgi:hypothetical protein
MIWPTFEGNKKIPEGHYTFKFNREPELLGFTYKDKDGQEKKGRKIKVYATTYDAVSNDEYRIIDAIVAWEDRYADLCAALRVEHGRDLQMEGAVFQADVKYEADKNDPTKAYPRLVNIKPHDDVPQGKDVGGDDIPF